MAFILTGSQQNRSKVLGMNIKGSPWLLVLMAALGYFVDIYDLVLFSVVRIPSLKALGFQGPDLLQYGIFLMNAQMLGMMVGGVLWGILADRKGRLPVLFGAVALYSLANFFNAFTQDVQWYGVLRFLAGVGLSGELGASITLICEVLPKEKRGWGTTIVATVGVSGAIVAGLVGDLLPWDTAYLVGAGLGTILLALRIAVMRGYESKMFLSARQKEGALSQLKLLFLNRGRLQRYLFSVGTGVPILFIIGILVTFSPEICASRLLPGEPGISAGRGIMASYLGLVFGDLVSGFLSQILQTRVRIMRLFIFFMALAIALYLLWPKFTTAQVYFCCLAMGFGAGYWAVLVTAASEQFGTNVRATVTTTVPNFIRGAVVPLALAFQSLGTRGIPPETIALILSAFVVVVALGSSFGMQDTFHKDLDYLE